MYIQRDDYYVNTKNGSTIKFNFCTALVTNPCSGQLAGLTNDNKTCAINLAGRDRDNDINFSRDYTRTGDSEEGGLSLLYAFGDECYDGSFKTTYQL